MSAMQSHENSRSEDSLNKLTTTVNQTLIEAGRFFRTSDSMQARARLKHTLPAANEEFQTALDQLSEQIFLAKSVFERDYKSIQAKKSTLQRANPPPIPMQTDRQDTSLESIQPSVTHGAILLPTDQPGGALVTDPQPTVQKNTSTGDSKNWENNSAHLPSPSRVVAVPNASHPDNDILKKESENTPQAAPDLSISPQEGEISGVNTLDSLLPGLKNYVNAGGEDTGSSANQQQQVSSNSNDNSNSHAVENYGRSSDVQMEDVPQSESNFENLFVGVDFGDPEDLLNNAEIGELDDSWFT